jgi:hypothetical protein
MSKVPHCCYRMVIVATCDNVMLLKTVATECYNNDGWFGDITEKPL